MQKHVNLVDLVKSFPTNILLQNLASIQERTSSLKFAHLAEKSENGSISNLSTKVRREARDRRDRPELSHRIIERDERNHELQREKSPQAVGQGRCGRSSRREGDG